MQIYLYLHHISLSSFLNWPGKLCYGFRELTDIRKLKNSKSCKKWPMNYLKINLIQNWILDLIHFLMHELHLKAKYMYDTWFLIITFINNNFNQRVSNYILLQEFYKVIRYILRRMYFSYYWILCLKRVMLTFKDVNKIAISFRINLYVH